ncbi:MAG: metal ABC transporter permease [Rickettsiales bacterium]|nr:metal ABC transporter permease [Rickettsiales bacterium]|tara:strand:- start:22474 stop:24240 length:1767 start_codon:yes stop_codon:yes gene_type:complete
MKTYSTYDLLKKIFTYCYVRASRGIKISLWITLLTLILGKVFSGVAPMVFKEGLNAISESGVSTYPFIMIVLYGVCYALGGSMMALKDLVFIPVDMNGVRTMALGLFKKIHRLSYDFHIQRKTGALTTIFEKGITSLERFLRFFVFSSLPMLFEILLIFGLLISFYEIAYSAVIFLTLFLYGYYTIRVANKRTHQARDMNKKQNEANAYAVDSLMNYETIKSFGRETLDIERYSSLFAQAQEARKRTMFSLGMLNFGQIAIMGLGLTLLLIMGFYDVQKGHFGVGDIVLLNMYLLQLFGPLSNLGFSYREMKIALTHIEQVEEIMDEQIEIQDKEGAKPIDVKNGEIQFNEVSFHYPNRKNIINNFNLMIPAKKRIAIVGDSGAGKSTLTRLLMRFYDVSSGKILIDGQDIRDVTQESLRSVLGVVPQDVVLFNMTIFDNIAFAKSGASQEEVECAAKAALIHDFIMTLPDGYQTIVGERGLKLSGGEKQRIAIARLVLKKPKIFIFDEATSSLDLQTEKDIQINLNQISEGFTTLVIAHRLSTIIDADIIFFMRNGSIVEQGTHDELLSKKGYYAALWQTQKKEKNL